MIIFLAGLQGIPRELYEAAEVDGAGALRKFWNITHADDRDQVEPPSGMPRSGGTYRVQVETDAPFKPCRSRWGRRGSALST
jgi:hypothetical protein